MEYCFKEYDKDHDNRLSYNEFCALMNSHRPASESIQVRLFTVPRLTCLLKPVIAPGRANEALFTDNSFYVQSYLGQFLEKDL